MKWTKLIRSSKLLSMTYMCIMIEWGIIFILCFNPKYDWDAGYPDLYNMIVGICEIIVYIVHISLMTISAGYFIIFPSVRGLDTWDKKREWILYIIPFVVTMLIMSLLWGNIKYWEIPGRWIRDFMEEYGDLLRELLRIR